MDPTEQIAPMWEAFLGQMTAQGATRTEIMGVALGCAVAVLDSTATALWRDNQVPDLEAEAYDAFRMAQELVRRKAEEIAAT